MPGDARELVCSASDRPIKRAEEYDEGKHQPGGDDIRKAPAHRCGVSREHPRQPRNLDLRPAGGRRHHPPGLSQQRPHGGGPLRRPSRPKACKDLDGAHRHRERRLHPLLLPRPAHHRRHGSGPRCDRGVATARVRLHGAQPGLQGQLLGHARRQRRLLRALSRKREALVPRLPGTGALPEPRHREPARRPGKAPGRGRRRLRPRRKGNRRGDRRERCQSGGHRLGAYPLQLYLALRPAASRPPLCGDLHGSDGCAGAQADRASILRNDCRPCGQPL